MHKLLEFSVIGVEPAPWRAPEHGSGVTKEGRHYHFCRTGGKSDIVNGRVNLNKWQKIVGEEASKAMGGASPFVGPLKICMKFIYRAPEPEMIGNIAWLPLKTSKKTEELVKPTLRGRTLPDIINLFKGTEDAMEGIVFHDDYQTRAIGDSEAVFGSHSGVRVTIYSMGEHHLEGNTGQIIGHAVAGGRVRKQPSRKKSSNRPAPGHTDCE